jgi:16S rRNA processing protein RimM
MKKEYLESGVVRGAHGVRGVLKVEHWCDSPKVLANQKRVFLQSKDGYTERKVLTASVSGAEILMSIEGIEDRDAAVAMKGTVLYLKREDIPLAKGAMFIQDMIGLPVIDADSGRVYGEIKSVDEGVRSKLYTISTPDGEVIYPSAPGFIKEVDAERGMFITPIPGFFTDDEI